MGAGQSSSKINSTTPQPSKDIERIELFSVIFMRLLKKTDILDIRALTKGPGACGDYIILLSNELNKEFGKIKLEASRDSTASSIQDFLFAKSKTVATESQTDQAACTSLAIFYMRALQLVAALTLSIYTPPDLVSRIRNRVFQSALKEQQKGVTLTLEQKEEQRIKREDWFKKFLSSSGSSKDVYQFQGKPSLKYNKLAQQLIFTDEDENEYRAKIAIKEPETYTTREELVKPGSYWIELANPKNDETIFRALVYSDKKAYHFENKKSVTNEIEEPILFVQNWTDELPSVFLQFITPVKPTPTTNNTRSTRGRFGFGFSGGTRKLRGGQYRRTNNNNNNTRRRNNTAAVPKANTSLDLSPTTSLPRGFQDSYRSILRWSTDFATWSEASPASYRAVLLYIQPTLPSGAPSSYLCVDNWNQKQLRYIPPFASLEALYFNRDDGNATPENQSKLSDLTNTFHNLYLQYYPAKMKSAPTKSMVNFMDVSTPPLNEAIRNKICAKRTAQGDVLISDPRITAVLEKAQKAILDEYKVHFENAYSFITKVFVTQKNASGEVTIKFSDAIVNTSRGARSELEDIIRVVRGTIANHYVTIETIYYEAIKDVINLS